MVIFWCPNIFNLDLQQILAEFCIGNLLRFEMIFSSFNRVRKRTTKKAQIKDLSRGIRKIWSLKPEKTSSVQCWLLHVLWQRKGNYFKIVNPLRRILVATINNFSTLFHLQGCSYYRNAFLSFFLCVFAVLIFIYTK